MLLFTSPDCNIHVTLQSIGNNMLSFNSFNDRNKKKKGKSSRFIDDFIKRIMKAENMSGIIPFFFSFPRITMNNSPALIKNEEKFSYL